MGRIRVTYDVTFKKKAIDLYLNEGLRVLVQIKDTFPKIMRIPTGIILYAVNPNN